MNKIFNFWDCLFKLIRSICLIVWKGNIMKKEIWKDLNLEGYSEFYQVSNLGQIKSKDREVEIKRKNGKISKKLNKGRIMKQRENNRGYRMCGIYDKNSKCKTVLIHRLIGFTFLTNDDPDKDQINHKNGKKNDNRVENLEWVNQNENMKHSFRENIRKPVVISKEQRENHSRIMKEKFKNKVHENAIPILRVDPVTKEVVEYPSATHVLKDDYFKDINISRQIISKRCREKNNKPYKGFIWKLK